MSRQNPPIQTARNIERPPVIERICFARDLFAHSGLPVWINRYPHHRPASLHEHDFLEIVLVVEGSADHLTVHGRQPLVPGDLIIIQPGQWHGYSATNSLWIINCCLSAELFSRELAWVHGDPHLSQLFPARMPRDDRERRTAHQGVRVLRFTGEQHQRLSDAYALLLHLCNAANSPRHRGELVARVLLLLEAIAAHADLLHREHGQGDRHLMDARVAKATAAMSRELAKTWALHELAEESGTSASHLLRLFRRDTGLAPIAWLAQRRAERLAVLLLTSERAVANLAPEVGWDDPSYCARRFRSCFGMSPDVYRRQHPALAVTTLRKE